MYKRQLLDLQEAKYSKVTEATLLNYVHHMERYQDRLNIFSAWLTLHQLESAEVHTEEAENLAVDTTALAERVLETIHNYEPPVPVAAAGAAGGAGQAAPLHVQGPTAKPVMALKPEKLSFDSNLGQVRRWKQRFLSLIHI